MTTPLDEFIVRWDQAEMDYPPDWHDLKRVEEKLGIVFDLDLAIARAIGGPLTRDPRDV
jgi:hypothetical protein